MANRIAKILCFRSSWKTFGLSSFLADHPSRRSFSVSVDSSLPLTSPILFSTLILSSTLPCSYNHRGDSGKINGSIKQMTKSGVKQARAEYFQSRKYHEVSKYIKPPNVQNRPNTAGKNDLYLASCSYLKILTEI